MTDASLFELEGVSFVTGGRTLLHDVTLSVPPGRILGLIGHNGSGKTTLVKLLARQQRPTRGVIRLAGRPLARWPERAYAREVAYLPQQPPMSDLAVEELVALGRYPWHGALGRFGAEDRARVAEAMALTGVDGFAGRHVGNLSGGERQRVWLAMLMAQNARCLLLDEPISALDVAHQVEVLDLIRLLSRERGIGVVVVLHDVNLAARSCDMLAALRRGRLLAHGPPGELMRVDTLQAIYGMRLGILPHPTTGLPMSYVP